MDRRVIHQRLNPVAKASHAETAGGEEHSAVARPGGAIMPVGRMGSGVGWLGITEGETGFLARVTSSVVSRIEIRRGVGREGVVSVVAAAEGVAVADIARAAGAALVNYPHRRLRLKYSKAEIAVESPVV